MILLVCVMSADTDKPFINTHQRINKLEQTILQQNIIIEQLKQQCNHHAITIEQLKQYITTQQQPKPQFHKGNRAIYSGKILVEIVDTIIIENQINYTIILDPHNTINPHKKIVTEDTLQLVNYNMSIPIHSEFNTLDPQNLHYIMINQIIEDTEVSSLEKQTRTNESALKNNENNKNRKKLLLDFGKEIGLFDD